MPLMGRRRTRDLHLPARVYFSRGSHFYVDLAGKWHPLGKEWDRAARAKWIELSTGKAAEGTVADLLEKFLTWTEGEIRAGRRSNRTYDDNESEAKMLKLVFGSTAWGAITSKHVARYLKERTNKHGKKAPIRANREVALLSSAYAWGMGEESMSIERNPCYGVRRNRETPRTRYVQTVELQRFKRFAPKWVRCYILLKRLTGLRQGDMLKLGRANVTDRGLELATGKTGKVLRFRWTKALRIVVDAIQKIERRPKAKQDNVTRLYFFASRYGTQLSPLGFKSAWQRAMNDYVAAGNERFWEHDIRGKTGSDAESLQRAQELLGHESSRTAARHYRRAPAVVRPLK
jgi:hypothetical protein